MSHPPAGRSCTAPDAHPRGAKPEGPPPVVGEPQLGQLLPAPGRHAQRAAVRNARDPAPLEKGLGEGGPDSAGEVMAALRPVDAGAAVPPLRAAGSPEI